MNGLRAADELAEATEGEDAQRGAAARRLLGDVSKAPAPSKPSGGWKGKAGRESGVAIYGHTDKKAYENEKLQYVAGLRNVGNYSLYRRGRVWAMAEVTTMDLKKDADKIKVIMRFSDEYFKLIRANTVAENQVMASQQADEELMVKLRDQVYLVK